MKLKSAWAYSFYAAILNNWILKLIIGLTLLSLFDLDIEGEGFIGFAPLVFNATITRFAVPDKYLVKESESLSVPTSFKPFYKISLIVFVAQLIIGELISIFLLPLIIS